MMCWHCMYANRPSLKDDGVSSSVADSQLLFLWCQPPVKTPNVVELERERRWWASPLSSKKYKYT